MANGGPACCFCCVIPQTTGSNVSVQTFATPYGYPGYTASGFWGTLSSVFGLLMILGIIYPVFNLVKSLVAEKENRIREGGWLLA
jgi:hypothetical protein